MSNSRTLITGARGQLGSDLSVVLAERGEVRAAGREDLDVTDDAAVAAAMASLSPTLVVNCAAFHNVDVCEREEDRSFEVNARAVKRLAQACAATGAKLVHFSTNYVFDGSGAEPYDEDARPAPQSVYAISKLAGEHAALAYAPDALVVRTAGLYGEHGSESKGGNFVTRMLARARKQGSLRMVADQRLTPTFTRDLARAVVEALDADAGGVLHLTNAGACSWHEFTLSIMDAAGSDVPVEAVQTDTGTGQVRRPRNGVLRSVRADALGLSPLRPWNEALSDYVLRLQ